MDRVRPRRVRAAARARSCTRPRRGRRPPAAARSRRCSSRTSAARRRFFTALGDDELGRALAGRSSRAEGVRASRRLGAAARSAAAFTYVDEAGERTITVIGEKHRPRGDDRRHSRGRSCTDCDCVYFTGGDVQALAKARHARVLVADRARAGDAPRRARVELDALVGSATDAGERYEAGELDPPPRLVVATSGRLGGWAQPGGPFEAAAAAGTVRGRLRRRRLLRRRAHVRARPRRRAARRRGPRGPLRRDRRDGPRPVRAPAHGGRLDAGLGE